MAGGGYDIGASFSGSSSAGSSLSGAVDQSGGGNFGGTTYGPGSVVTGALGEPNYVITVLIAGAVLLAVYAVRKIFK